MSDADDDHKTEATLIKTFLNLEEIDPLLYRSTYLFKPVLGKAVFGGQVVGQALVAASNTVPNGREVNSLHSYFLKPGKIDNPILYQVLKIRDGMTYSNRFVRATQMGKTIFTMMVSFKESEADIYSHQFTMPQVPGPEGLLDVTQILKQRLGNEDVHKVEKMYIEKRLTEEITATVKPCDPRTILRTENSPAKQCVWMKVNGHIGDSQQMHRCATAYMSDSYLLLTATLPNAEQHRLRSFVSASIDHSIWFHHHIKADEWLLYEMESPKCAEGRALVNGRFWDRKGTLRMSVSQEGLIRKINKSREGSSFGPNVDTGRKTGHVSGTGGGNSASVGQTREYSTYQGHYCLSKKGKISTLMNPKTVLSFTRRILSFL